jgi:hypothetical protein
MLELWVVLVQHSQPCHAYSPCIDYRFAALFCRLVMVDPPLSTVLFYTRMLSDIFGRLLPRALICTVFTMILLPFAVSVCFLVLFTGAVLYTHAVRHSRPAAASEEGSGDHQPRSSAGAVRSAAAVLRCILCISPGGFLVS